VPVITPRRLFLTVVVGAALFLFVLAFTWQGDAADTPTADAAAVERVLPAEGSPGVLRQTTIEVDLAPGWTGALQVNGQELGPDQVNCIDDCELPVCDRSAPTAPGSGGGAPSGRRQCRTASDPQNRLYYVPGPGKQIEQLPTGETCATAVIWLQTESRATSQDVSWCFRVTA